MPSDTRKKYEDMIVGDYKLRNRIGAGTAGVVFRAKPLSSIPSTTDVAIKLIPASRVGLRVRREVESHFSFVHPNIVQLLEVLAAPPSPSDPSEGSPLALVMELCEKGDLFDELSSNGVLPASLVRRHLRDIANGLNYLHTREFVHGDLKLENIAITADGTAKLLDFGCSRQVQAQNSSDLEQFGGTVQYLAPEMIPVPGKPGGAPPSCETDLWALGVMLYTCTVGCYPFDGMSDGSSRYQSEAEVDAKTRHNILHEKPAPFPSSISVPSDIQCLIDGLLQKNPTKRLTLDQVIAKLSTKPQPSHLQLSGLQSQSAFQSKDKLSSARRTNKSDDSRTSEDDRQTGKRRQTMSEVLSIVDVIRVQRTTRILEASRLCNEKSSPRKSRSTAYARAG